MQNQLDDQSRLLSAFTTALLDTRFAVQVQRCVPDVDTRLLDTQVALICKKVAIRDVDSVLQQLMRAKLTQFIKLQRFVVFREPDAENLVDSS